jgi:hypothetical protein
VWATEMGIMCFCNKKAKCKHLTTKWLLALVGSRIGSKRVGKLQSKIDDGIPLQTTSPSLERADTNTSAKGSSTALR